MNDQMIETFRPKSVHFCGLLLGALMLTAACAPVEKRSPRFFWPPGVDVPRIEYINFFVADQDIKRGQENRLEEFIFGKVEARQVFERPLAIASDGRGRVLVSDVGLHKVFVFDNVRHEIRSLQSRGSEMRFSFPLGLDVDAGGRAYVVEPFDKKLLVFGENEQYLNSLDLSPLTRPTNIAVDVARDRLYVADTGSHQVAVFRLDGKMLRTVGQRGTEQGQFNFPVDVDVDAEGNLYVLDSMNARVQVFDPEGVFLRAFGERGTALGSFQIAKSLAVGPSGQVYVTDSQAHRIVIFSLQGDYLLSVGGRSRVTDEGVSPGGFNLPEGIDVDANDTIWVVDSLNRMFHQFQYLNEAYLAVHPIRPDEVYLPPNFHRSEDALPPPATAPRP